MTPDHDPTRTSPPADADATRTGGGADVTRTVADTSDAVTEFPADPVPATRGTHSEIGTASLAAVGVVEAFQRALSSTPPAAEFDPPPGFVLEREIGAGGMGVVYKARQLGLNRPVALKLVRDARVDAKAIIRFLAEAEVVAAIRHPHVVEVYQYGEHGGRPYMALEFCPGGDLTSLTKSSPTLDAAWFRKVADLMAKVADGVNAAHAQGIVHRDLKPHNVFMTADGTPKVADFGLAKRGLGSDLTKTDAIMGTPAYMAPEQAAGRTKFVGPEADVWALGVMLYELCCGVRPIDTSGPVLDALARVANPSIPSLRTILPTVPIDLSLVLHKCLSTDPRDRYPTAGALAADLRNWLEGKPISARRAGVIEQAVKWAKRNRRLAVMGLAVILTMAVATGISCGFGLYANEQRGRAEFATSQAVEDKKAAVAARVDTQHTLALALLGPIQSDESEGLLNGYERKALWQLAALRDTPVPSLLLQEAVRSESTAAQLRCRAEHLVHAAVGLDSRRRNEVEDLLSAALREPSYSVLHKRDLALCAVEVGSLQSPPEVAPALLSAFRSRSRGERLRTLVKDGIYRRVEAPQVLATGGGDASLLAQCMSRACERLPAEEGTTALLAALQLASEANDRAVLGRSLSTLLPQLPAERALAVWLDTPLRKGERGPLMVFAGNLDLVCQRLPATQALNVLLAEVLEGRSRANGLWPTVPGEPPDAYRGLPLVDGLAKVSERMLPTKASDGCERAAGELLTALLSSDDRADAALDRAFSTPESSADRVWYWRRALAGGLWAVSARMPSDRAAAVCEQATTFLAGVQHKASGPFERAACAEAIVALAGRLPAAKGEVLQAALREAQEERECVTLGAGAVSAAVRRHQEDKSPTVEEAVDLLFASLAKAKPSPVDLASDLPGALAVALEHLPAGRGARKLVPEMKRSAGGQRPVDFAKVLAQQLSRLPADERTVVSDEGVDTFVAVAQGNKDPQVCEAMARGLAVVAAAASESRARVADDTLSGMLRSMDALSAAAVVDAMVVVFARLSSAAAEASCGKAARLLLDRTREAKTRKVTFLFHTSDRRLFAESLARLTPWLSREEGVRIGRQAASALLAAFDSSPHLVEEIALVVALANFASHLSAEMLDKANLALQRVLHMAIVSAGEGEVGFHLRDLTQGVLAVGSRLPVDNRVGLFGRAISLVYEHLQSSKPAALRGELFRCLALMAASLPLNQQALVLIEGFALLGRREASISDIPFLSLPQGRRTDRLFRKPSWPATAALLGVTLARTEELPVAWWLSDQSLVELLKHPFCVREARRAVLDALELTYDRRFADLWAFVAFAEHEHPELDLLTPPKRPERK